MPLTAAEGLLHAAATAPGDKSKTVGVAVSGGSDSLAALLLMVAAGWQVHAVTVDHGLRPEAAGEAAFVAGICAGLGVAHDVLAWQAGPRAAGNLMDQARQARYGLLADWAVARGIGSVVLGHTADDQAETFLMGLGRAAGLDGLVGMRGQWRAGGVMFCRPFLGQSRGALRAYLAGQGVGWVDDPTNEDGHYTRIKARRALRALKPLGITVDRLGVVIRNLAMAQEVLRAAVSRAAEDVAREVAGAVVIERAGLAGLPPEVQRRLVIAGLAWVSGAAYAPRAAAVDRIQGAIAAGRDAVLAGCRVRVTVGAVRVLREARAAGGEVATDAVWDGRWQLTGPHAAGLTVRALGDGLRQCNDWRATGLPRDVLVVTPAIWRGEVLVAAPLAGFTQGWTANLAQSLHASMLSH